jgi:hypothetical protein
VRKKRSRGAQFEDKFLRALAKHLSRDFPNPKRLGCPTEEELRGLSTRPARAQHWIVQHLMYCSPCYLAYRKILGK